MEAEDEGGATPLHLAAAATRAAAARLLLDEAGARPEARDGCGRSPLDLASLLRPSSAEIVTPLLARAGAVAAARAETPTAAANSAANSAANAQAAEGSAACEHLGAPLAAASATSASSASPGRDAPPPPPLPTSSPLAAYRERALQAPPQYAPTLLHAEPWLVQLDGLLSRAEARALLDKCRGRWHAAQTKSAPG